MANQSLAPQTYPFISEVSGNLVRVMKSPGHVPVLETSGGLFIEYAAITGPEILKLSSQGRELWRVCKQLVKVAYAAGLRDAQGQPDGPLEDALRVLDATAQTFDHNEPEESPVERRPRHDPNRPIPLVGPEEVERG